MVYYPDCNCLTLIALPCLLPGCGPVPPAGFGPRVAPGGVTSPALTSAAGRVTGRDLARERDGRWTARLELVAADYMYLLGSCIEVLLSFTKRLDP